MRNTVAVWNFDTWRRTTHTRKLRGTRKKFIRPARVASGMCWPLKEEMREIERYGGRQIKSEREGAGQTVRERTRRAREKEEETSLFSFTLVFRLSATTYHSRSQRQGSPS
jgi:hypothetical protein